jgi:hypothetical protein
MGFGTPSATLAVPIVAASLLTQALLFVSKL